MSGSRLFELESITRNIGGTVLTHWRWRRVGGDWSLWFPSEDTARHAAELSTGQVRCGEVSSFWCPSARQYRCGEHKTSDAVLVRNHAQGTKTDVQCEYGLP